MCKKFPSWNQKVSTILFSAASTSAYLRISVLKANPKANLKRILAAALFALLLAALGLVYVRFSEKPTGIHLARRLQEKNSRLNIIFATVCSEREYAEECMEIRPSAYLKKVVTKKDVKHALRNLLYA